MDYIETFGAMIPAKMAGKAWNGGFFGSETSKRCRELRKEGKLVSENVGKFERYTLPQRDQIPQGQMFPVNQIMFNQ